MTDPARIDQEHWEADAARNAEIQECREKHYRELCNDPVRVMELLSELTDPETNKFLAEAVRCHKLWPTQFFTKERKLELMEGLVEQIDIVIGQEVDRLTDEEMNL